MNNSLRKRKRHYGDSNKKLFDQDGDEETSTSTIAASSSTTTTGSTTTKQKQQKQRINQVSQNLLFRDKIVVVTTLQQQQQESSDTNSTLLNDDTTNDDAPPETTNNDTKNGELTIGNTYKSVASFVQQHLGATITHQVHSRVYCVIASPQAIQEPTQRIRKAWKRNIPVVTTQYIYDCVQQQFLIPIPTIHEMPNQYRILPSSSASKSSSITKKTSIVLPTTPSDHMNEDENVDIPDERIIDLGCCCICHDNDDTINDPCEWCIDCSYTKETTIK